MIRLSAIVIAKNEASHIGGCLDSLRFTDDIVVVVDTASTDETLNIARRKADQIFIRDWMGYSETKAFALSKTIHPWVIWLDADERIPPELADEIRSRLNSAPVETAFSMPRRAFFLGRWIRHGGWYPGCVTRLFRKDSIRFSHNAVHEKAIIHGHTGRLKNALDHFTDDSVRHYFHKFNDYTSLAARDASGKKKKRNGVELIFRFVHMFLKMYVFRFGFLDGIEGLLLAVFSSHYVFVKYAKLWEPDRDTEFS